MKHCHFCENPAGWQITSSHWKTTKVFDSKWTLRMVNKHATAQVCEEHLIERLSDNSAYHLVYRLGEGLGPDAIDWAVLIEKCHRHNQEFCDRETFL